MGPIAYSLCQKPIIGVVMLITSLCVFPPLVENEPIVLLQPDTKVEKAFSVSVAKRYQLELTFHFASAQDRLADQLVKGMVNDRCMDYDPSRGLFKITVTKTPDQSVVLQRVVTSLCTGGLTTTDKFETIGWLELAQGDYILEVVNMQAHPGLEHVETKLSLVAGHGK